MINDSIKKLQSQIDKLESKIERFEKSSIDKINTLGFSVWTKNLLNFKVSDRRKFHIATIDNNQKNNLFFQIKTSFYNYSEQMVQFDLYCDNIKIGSEIQTFDNNLCEITVCGTFQNFVSDKIEVYLVANPKNKKRISIITSTLTIWGISQTQTEEYNATQTLDKYFLSYISNNHLYYKIFDKNIEDTEFDFEFKGDYISHSICSNNNNLYLMKIDLDGNLFFEDIQANQEIFITSNTRKVSSCYYQDSIYFAYISNNDCYYGEIKNNVVISNKKLTSLFGKFNSCYLYSNPFINKCYLILNKLDGSNYLLENIPEIFKSDENIIANINLSISIKEGI